MLHKYKEKITRNHGEAHSAGAIGWCSVESIGKGEQYNAGKKGKRNGGVDNSQKFNEEKNIQENGHEISSFVLNHSIKNIHVIHDHVNCRPSAVFFLFFFQAEIRHTNSHANA